MTWVGWLLGRADTQVLAKIAPSTNQGNNRLSAGQVHAVFRMLSHRRNGVLDPELVFVPGEFEPVELEGLAVAVLALTSL